MQPEKSFDCVRLKDEIQARVHKQWEGLTPEQVQAELRAHLARSTSEVAVWWRAVQTKHAETQSRPKRVP
jgi:hypothetical protein